MGFEPLCHYALEGFNIESRLACQLELKPPDHQVVGSKPVEQKSYLNKTFDAKTNSSIGGK